MSDYEEALDKLIDAAILNQTVRIEYEIIQSNPHMPKRRIVKIERHNDYSWRNKPYTSWVRVWRSETHNLQADTAKRVCDPYEAIKLLKQSHGIADE